MKSKFKYWAYFVFLLSIICSIGLGMELSGSILNKNMPLVFFILFSTFFIFVWVFMVFGELRLKAIYVTIDYNSVSVKHYLGLGKARVYDFDLIEGYITSILSSQSGSYEYLYLIVNNKKVAKISEFYHSNYAELKSNIVNRKFRNLGFERFNYLKELKEIFTST